MLATGTMAIVPKARGMYAKHISMGEYEEMLRRRTVPEVALLLRRHPYFGDSLATLTQDPHRGQIEELLSMDVFAKFEKMQRYDFGKDTFSGYFLRECELREIMKAIHLLSIGFAGGYRSQVPPYLVGKVQVDLFVMGAATSLPALLESLRHTPYYRVLAECLRADPLLRDFPATEAVLLRGYYADVFERIAHSLSGRERQMVEELFHLEAELYNLELIVRVKTYFPHVYTPASLYGLLLPYTCRVPQHRLRALVEAPGPDALWAQMQAKPMAQFVTHKYTGEPTVDGRQALYTRAKRLLRLSASPHAAMAAFMMLAKLERENAVNLIEGVRYGLKAEEIRSMLCF